MLFAYYKHVIDSYNNEVSAQLNSTQLIRMRAVCVRSAQFSSCILLQSAARIMSVSCTVHAEGRACSWICLYGYSSGYSRCDAMHTVYTYVERGKSRIVHVWLLVRALRRVEGKIRELLEWVPIIVRRREKVAWRRCRPLMWKVRGDKYGAV